MTLRKSLIPSELILKNIADCACRLQLNYRKNYSSEMKSSKLIGVWPTCGFIATQIYHQADLP